MIRFYPRDIQLWRKTFKWNGISEPSKIFDSVDGIVEAVAESFVITE